MHIFSFAPERLGGIDMLLPLFLELKQRNRNTRIEVVFSETKTWNALQNDPFLSTLFLQIVDNVWILDKQKLLGMPYWAKILGISIRILLSTAPTFLHSRDRSDRRVSLLRRLAKFRKGHSFLHFSSLSYMRDCLPETSKISSQNDDDRFLCFSTYDLPYLEAAGYRQITPIGYTRLYDSWLETVKSAGKTLFISELETLSKIETQSVILVYVPSTVEGVFNKAELRAWLPEVIQTVFKVYSDVFILLKPHPMQDMALLNEIVADIKCDNLGISFLHAGVLASGASIAISHHSSVIIDSMSLGVPTIQHQTFTAHWLERHPEGSSMLKIGPLWTQSARELEDALQVHRLGEWQLPDIAGNMMHCTELSEFTSESVQTAA